MKYPVEIHDVSGPRVEWWSEERIRQERRAVGTTTYAPYHCRECGRMHPATSDRFGPGAPLPPPLCPNAVVTRPVVVVS